ncbi:MAG TPA: LysR family transcriptional regulator [Povalibacter sp.]|uniref:LysR family transcriptional regulator n=1 Tax=Povalibacter sp. TaxID=1962978 RepID=UPI002CB9CCD1|nr:LysR family transcriptional regulator [Povalibacter sp.]HMN46546.1 LysR family transcriptional regulator [Povalibacter sp.]
MPAAPSRGPCIAADPGDNRPMQIERNEIRCFHAVIEAGGFSRAAERLDISQSAVSQAIANLEHRLGTVLLRRGNPPQLTEAGIRLLRFAETMMNEERETLADIAQIRSGARSTLSLAMSPAANARFGVALLKDFSERNPLTRFKVVVAPSREIVYGVSEGRWELGFGPLQHSMPDYFAIHACFSETRRLLIAADHPSRDALRRDPQGILRTLPLVTSYLDDLARRPSGDRLRNAFASVWEVSHMDLRLALVAEGKGVTYVSDLVTHLPANLVPIEGLPFSRIDRQVGVYYLKHQPMSQAGARFLALCRERWGV